MASKPVANGYKANYALTEAAKSSNRTIQVVQSANDELRKMQESLGRPNYNRISSFLLELGMTVSITSRHLNELQALRAQAAQPVGEEVMAQLSDLQAEVAELRDQVARMNDPVYPRGYRQ